MSERLSKVLNHPPVGRTRLVAYLMAGDPNPETSVRRLRGLADCGVDIMELGIPFSDPMADGPVIQAAAERALAAGMTVAKSLEIVQEFRTTHDTPLLLMSYLNPLLQYGWEKFVRDAVESGVDGLILPDLPWRESKGLRELTSTLVGEKLTFIPMIAQTSQERDVLAIAEQNQGFVYVLSRNGITGGEAEIPDKVLEFVENLKYHLSIPRCVGFGIQKPEQVERLATVADGVVVGSAIVKRFALLDQEKLLETELQERENDIFAWIRTLKGKY